MKSVPFTSCRTARGLALVAGALLFLTSVVSANVTAAAPETTWDRAEIWAPPAIAGVFRTNMDDGALHTRLLEKGVKLPTVVFLHGCTPGRKPAGWTMGRTLARAGYAVILPDSFLRTDRPATCNRWTFEPVANTDRHAVLALRQEEIALALDRVRALPWVDDKNLFLMGYDEGADALAAWHGAGVNARVLISTRCPIGLNAPHTPTLTLGGTDDVIDCVQPLSACASQGPTEQVNFETTFHDLTGLPAAREEILAFLARHRAKSQ